MSEHIYNPAQPYTGIIEGGFTNGKIVHVTGVFNQNGNSIVIKFMTGPNGDPSDEIGLCIYGRLNERILGMNAFLRSSGWGIEEAHGNEHFNKGQQFEIAILSDSQSFKIAINGQHWGEFAHKINPSFLTNFNIASMPSDLTLSCVWVESPAGYTPSPTMNSPYPTSAGPTPYPTSAGTGFGFQNSQPYSQNVGYPKKKKGLLGDLETAGAALAGSLGVSNLLGKKSKSHTNLGEASYSSGPGPGGYPTQYPGAPPQYPGYPQSNNPGYPTSGAYPPQGGYQNPGAYPSQGGYPGAYPSQGGYPGAYPSQGGYPGGHASSSGGLVNKALGVGGAVLGAKAVSKGMGKSPKGGLGSILGGSKALKYGIPLAGAGLGGYMLSKGLSRSFSWDSFDCGGSNSGSGSCSDCSD